MTTTPDHSHDPRESPSTDPDFRTPEGLRSALRKLTDEGTWATSPVAGQLMAYVTSKYTPVAKAWHRSPDDAAYEAFIAMRSSSTMKADDPWAVITRAVELGIAAETHAERLLTSSDKARRPKKRPEFEPVRAGHYEEFFYDVHPHATDLHGRRDADTTNDGEAGHELDGVMHTVCVFLIVSGWEAVAVEQAVGYISHRITGLASHDSALDVLGTDLALAVRLGYSSDTWNALLRLLIGTKDRKRREGQVGLFARALLGDRIADLLRDEDLVTRSRSAATRTDETGPAS